MQTKRLEEGSRKTARISKRMIVSVYFESISFHLDVLVLSRYVSFMNAAAMIGHADHGTLNRSESLRSRL